MIDKFQKLFGPNPPRATSARPSTLSEEMELAAGDEEHRRQVARVKNKRRFIGLLAIAAAVAVVAPGLFEPNDMYASRGAKLEIPSLQNETAAKVVSLNIPKEVKKPAANLAGDEPAAAKSLKSDNPVTAGAKPITTAEQKTAEQKTAPAKAGDAAKKTAQPKKEAAAAAQNAAPLRAVTNGRYYIQVVATSRKESAEKVAGDLRRLGLPCYTEIVRRRGSDLWRVRVGRFATEDDARRALDILALNAVNNGGIHSETK